MWAIAPEKAICPKPRFPSSTYSQQETLEPAPEGIEETLVSKIQSEGSWNPPEASF